MIRKPQTASFPDNDIRPDNYRSIMDAVQVPHLLDEGGFLQGVIPIGWRDRFYHWVRRWFAVFLPVSLLFLLFFWLRCGRPRKRKRYAIGEAALPPEEEFNAICSAPGKTVRLVYLQVRCWAHTAAHMHGNQVVAVYVHIHGAKWSNRWYAYSSVENIEGEQRWWTGNYVVRFSSHAPDQDCSG